MMNPPVPNPLRRSLAAEWRLHLGVNHQHYREEGTSLGDRGVQRWRLAKSPANHASWVWTSGSVLESWIAPGSGRAVLARVH